jgi:flagellar hook-associated protein 2
MAGISGIRFGGIASGLDTESIVKQLMQVERMKVDRYAQKKQTLEWRRDDYRDINTKLLALRNSAFDMQLQGSFLGKKTTSSDETALKATANANAVEGSFEIVVKQLASGITRESNYSSDTGIVDDKLAAGGSFKLNGVEISLNAGDSMAALAAKINQVADQTNVKATYDTDKNLFYLMTTNTGSDAAINITDSQFSEVSFLQNVSSGSGQNAIITFNGGSDIEFASNQFTFNNINFNLLKADPSTTVNLAVENDLDAIVDKIKAFIENYNSVMEKLNGKLTEKRYRDYAPLTDEQKADMNESDIEKWEERARSGLLSGDTLLSGLYSNIRMASSSAIAGEGKYRTFSSIGITTLAWYDQGKLHIDEEKLRNALTEDMDGVIKLFTATQETDGSDGIANRLYSTINKGMKSITEKAGSASSLVDQSFLGKEIDDVNDRIGQMEDQLLRVEQRYWAQFTAMESALQQMQSQSDWLNAQLGGMSS